MPEYHGWTHVPKAQGGTDPIPTVPTVIPAFRARMTTPLTVAVGNTEQIEWDDWDVSDASYFDISASGSPSKLDTLIPLKQGVYSVRIACDWDEFNGNHTIGLGDTWINSCNRGSRVGLVRDPLGFGGAFEFSVTMAVPTYWGIDVAPPADGNTQAIWFVDVIHGSASPQDLNGAIWEVFYLGSTSLTAVACW